MSGRRLRVITGRLAAAFPDLDLVGHAGGGRGLVQVCALARVAHAGVDLRHETRGGGGMAAAGTKEGASGGRAKGANQTGQGKARQRVMAATGHLMRLGEADDQGQAHARVGAGDEGDGKGRGGGAGGGHGCGSERQGKAKAGARRGLQVLWLCAGARYGECRGTSASIGEAGRKLEMDRRFRVWSSNDRGSGIFSCLCVTPPAPHAAHRVW